MVSSARRRAIAASRPKAKPKGGSRIPRPPTGAELDYQRATLRMMKDLGTAVAPELDVIANDNGKREDARSNEARLRAQVERIVNRHVQTGLVSNAARGVNASNLTEMQRVLGMDRNALLPGASLAKWTRENVELITSIGDEFVDQVEEVVSGALNSGMRVETLRARIQERFEVAKSRAALIARDQVLKANAQLAEARMRHVGVKRYVWRATMDSRTRHTHAALNGHEFSFDEPPIVDPKTGRRANPGEDFQCRCQAEPIFEADETTGSSGTSTSEEPDTPQSPVVELPEPLPAPPPPAPPRHEARGQVPIAATPRQAVEEATHLASSPAPIAGVRVYGRQARDELRRIIQSAHPDLRSADVFDAARRGDGDIRSRDGIARPGSRALAYHHWNGAIEVEERVMQQAQRGLSAIARGAKIDPRSEDAFGVHVLIHESMHEHSPITPYAYQGSGAVIEEVTTELLARDSMRQLDVYSDEDFLLHGAYQDEIERSVAAVRQYSATMGHLTEREIAERLVQATVDLRRREVLIQNEDEYVQAFGEAVGVPVSDMASFRNALGDL